MAVYGALAHTYCGPRHCRLRPFRRLAPRRQRLLLHHRLDHGGLWRPGAGAPLLLHLLLHRHPLSPGAPGDAPQLLHLLPRGEGDGGGEGSAQPAAQEMLDRDIHTVDTQYIHIISQHLVTHKYISRKGMVRILVAVCNDNKKKHTPCMSCDAQHDVLAKTRLNRSGFGLRPDEELLDEEGQRRQNRRSAPVFLGFLDLHRRPMASHPLAPPTPSKAFKNCTQTHRNTTT